MRDIALRLEVRRGNYTEVTGETSSVVDTKVVAGFGDIDKTGFGLEGGRLTLPYKSGQGLELRATSSGEQPRPADAHLFPLGDKGMFADNPMNALGPIPESVRRLLGDDMISLTVYTYMGMSAVNAVLQQLRAKDVEGQPGASYLLRASEFLLENTREEQ